MLHPLSVHHDAVGGTQIDDVDLQARTCRVYPDLRVPARDPGVVDAQVGLAPATDHQSRRLQWMPRAVDFEHKWRSVDGRLTCPTRAWCDAGDRLRGDGEAAGGQVGVKLEADLDRAIEYVSHFAGVVTQPSRQFGLQRVGLRIEFALQTRCDLDRLHIALERAREDAVDSALHFFLKARENAHVPPSPRFT